MSNTLKFGNGEWYGKEGTILAYNDENNNYKPLPFNFERDSVATRVNKQGLIETVGADQPRIDYLNDSNGALLLEPSRANLYTYSNDVSFWTKNNVTTTSDYAISPDGTQNAFRAQFTSSTGLLYITATGTTGTDNTLSVWAKSNNGSSNKFRFFANGNTTLSDDFIATDEWQRFEFTFNCTSVTAGLTGASDSATNDILFYGFQHEVGSYATSYIPTQGGSVTRVADFCSQTPPDGVIGQTEGVVYCNFKINNNPTSTRRVVIMSNGTGNERIGISLGNNILYAFIVDGGSTQCEIVKSSITSGNYKCAFAYNNNDFVFYVNGSQVGTDTNGTVATCDTIEVGNQFGTSVLEGSINDIKLYNTRLSNSELAALTQV
jgi:hypothetical protein